MTRSTITPFTRLYIIALSLVAGLTLTGQWLIQRQIQDQLNDSWVVNFAGRQRFQSQQISKDALLLTNPVYRRDRAVYLTELRQVLPAWERYHDQLRTGQLADLQTTVQNTPAIKTMFDRLEPTFQAIRQPAHQLIDLLSNPAEPTSTQLENMVQPIVARNMSFLRQMDAIVGQYQREARAKVERLRGAERVLLAITLFVLLLEAILVFNPAVQTLRRALESLTVSERRAVDVSDQLRTVNESLRQTQIQLIRETALRHQQQLNEQRIRLASLVQGQDEERKRLSRELHDGIGQMLTGLKLLSENIRSADNLTERDQTTFANLKSLLVRTIQETRNVSNNLMPPVLSDFGLVAALRQLTEQQSRESDQIISLHSALEKRRFGQSVEIGLYRIAQEAVHNAIKHAGAESIQVDLSIRHQQLILRIADDGCGLPPDVLSGPTGSQGLHNMRERAKLLGGRFRLLSKPDRGTRVLISLPLVAEAVENPKSTRRGEVDYAAQTHL